MPAARQRRRKRPRANLALCFAPYVNIQLETADARRINQRRTFVERWFYVSTAIVALAIVIAGFSPSIVDQTSRRAPLTPLVIAHGAVFVAWLLVYLIQTVLAATSRVAVHRRLGAAAAGLVPIMIFVGFQTTVAMVRRGFELSGDVDVDGDSLRAAVVNFGSLLDFSILVSAALLYRRRPDVHKRLMLLAVLGGLMPAPVTHLLGHVGANRGFIAPIVLVLFFSGAIFDRITRGRIHPVSLWAGVALFLVTNLRVFVIGPSAAWHRFAAWLIS
jgi:hypothetical protein